MGLKVCVLELVSVCVQCQPGMAELFLCVRPSSTQVSGRVCVVCGPITLPTQTGGYTMNQSSCLKAVLAIIASATTQSKVSLLVDPPPHTHTHTSSCYYPKPHYLQSLFVLSSPPPPPEVIMASFMLYVVDKYARDLYMENANF